MHRILFLLASFGLATAALAQEQNIDSLMALGWRAGLTGQLSATQTGFQNWNQGGVNSFAFTVGADGEAKRLSGRWEQAHQLRLNFGLIRQDVEGAEAVRKSADLILFRSTLKYRGEGFFRTFKPTVAQEARTQFAKGFNYSENPYDDERELPVVVSEFLSPGTFTQTVGLTYDPEEWVSIRLGIDLKETLVLEEQFRPLYNVDVDRAARVELGLGLTTSVEKEIFENVQYKSTLGLFEAFNAEAPDVLWENFIVMQVNRWLNVTFEFVSLYDRDQAKEVQLKEVLALGVSVVLI